jgi:hypothetical protein
MAGAQNSRRSHAAALNLPCGDDELTFITGSFTFMETDPRRAALLQSTPMPAEEANMNAIMMLAAHRQTLASDDEAALLRRAAEDESKLAMWESMSGPEALLDVSFVGLDAGEQRKALASFPGARRCLLAVN